MVVNRDNLTKYEHQVIVDSITENYDNDYEFLASKYTDKCDEADSLQKSLDTSIEKLQKLTDHKITKEDIETAKQWVRYYNSSH